VNAQSVPSSGCDLGSDQVGGDAGGEEVCALGHPTVKVGNGGGDFVEVLSRYQ